MPDSVWVTFKTVAKWSPGNVNSFTSVAFNTLNQRFQFATAAVSASESKWVNFYQRYYIPYAWISLRPITNDIEAAELCVYATQDVNPVSTITGATEQRYSKFLTLAGVEYTNQTLSLGMSVKKLYGRPLTGVDWDGEFNTGSPGKLAYFHCSYNADDSINTSTKVVVTLWQRCRLFRPKTLSA